METPLIRLSLVIYIDKEKDVELLHDALVEVVEKFDYTCFISSAPDEEKDKEESEA